MNEPEQIPHPLEKSLEQLYGRPQPRPEFAAQLEKRLLVQAQQPRPVRRYAHLTGLGRIFAGALGLGLMALALILGVQRLLPSSEPASSAGPTETPSAAGTPFGDTPAAPATTVITATATPASTALASPTPRTPAQPARLAERVCAEMAALPPNGAVWSDRPEKTLGGGRVQSGDFSLEIWLVCDEQFDRIAESGTASEIERLGVYVTRSYQGQRQDGDVYIFSGVTPYLEERASAGPTLDPGMTGEDRFGITFPEAIFPDFSQGETRLRYAYLMKAPDGQRYAAALDFTLHPEADGYSITAGTPVELDAQELDGQAAAATPPFPLQNLAQIEPILGTLQMLVERGNAALNGTPGWLHQVMRSASSDPAYSLPNGTLVPPEILEDHWFLLDEQSQVTAMVYRMLDLSGKPLQETVYTQGVYHNITLGEIIENVPPPLAEGAGNGLLDSARQAVKNGRRLSQETVVLENSVAGIWFEIETAGGKTRALFNANSGQIIALEMWVKQSDGTEIRPHSLEILTVEHVAAPPAEILALFDQPLTPYQPLPPQGTPAPAGFDPSQSRLEMKMVAGDDPYTPNFWLGDLYADGYLLGRVDFGNVPGGWCDRSGDGSKLAFNYVVASNDRPYETYLRWFDLRQVTTVYDPIPGISMVSPPSWAPQGTQMAFFACAESACGVYLLEAATGELRWLSAISGSGMPPLWKPDGTEIAFTLSDPGDPENRVMLYILRVSDGMPIYQRYLVDGNPPADAPLAAWGVSLPQDTGGFADCTQAP